MPRTARKKSNTGIYHVILRGNNRQQIFEDKEDFQKFIYILKDYKESCNFKLYAYSLMSNHIHLLIEEGDESISSTIKRISCRFVYWYNHKYERIGHLFQDRFRSEVVENDRYFLTVTRYIHQNPVKAGLIDSAERYPWSSCRCYFQKKNSLVNTSKLMSLLGNKENVLLFFNTISSDICLDIPTSTPLADEAAKRIIYRISNCKNVTQFQALDPSLKKVFIKSMKKCGLSNRQISRLCGVSRYFITQI